MAEHAPCGLRLRLSTRNPEMIELAKANFASMIAVSRSPCWKASDAVDLLETLEDSYDLVFMDSAKSKYVVFCPALKRLNPGGLVLIDDASKVARCCQAFEEIAYRRFINGHLPRSA